MNPEHFPANSRRNEQFNDANLILRHVESKYPPLNPRDFVDIFPAEEIERDLADTARLEHNFSQKLDHLNSDQRAAVEAGEAISKTLEGIVIDQTRRSAWLGLATGIVRSSRYDDTHNGVDAIAEFATEDAPERMALAIDASRAADQTVISNKIERNLKKILNDDLESTVKYFASAEDDFRGPLDAIVPVVIGLDTQHCNELIDLLAKLIRVQGIENRTAALQEKFIETRDALERHPAQTTFLKQIEVQLDFYEEMLRKNKVTEKRKKILDQATSLKSIIQAILKEKTQTDNIRTTASYEKDSVLRNIREVTNRLRIRP